MPARPVDKSRRALATQVARVPPRPAGRSRRTLATRIARVPAVPRRRHVLTAAVATGALLTGCSSPVGLSPGDLAADPTCARVVMATPDALGGLERRSTTAQATTAWGDPAVTVRCGVTPPGPTTDRCLTVEATDGTAVDWIALEGDDPSLPVHARRDQGSWSFVTYGREPAIEVVVPVEQVSGQPTAFLVDLADAVENSSAERFCVGADDVS